MTFVNPEPVNPELVNPELVNPELVNPEQVNPVPLERTWTDPYGGACALLHGEYGGGTLLLACTLEHSSAVLERIARFPAFKGNLFFCVWQQSWRVPLEQAVFEFSPRATFLVSSAAPEAQTVQVESGLCFLEDGRGWQNLHFDALECSPETLFQTFKAELERRGWLAFVEVAQVEVSQVEVAQ